MKNFGRFTLNLESEFLEDNEESFKSDLASSPGTIGFMYPHYYDEDDKISSYGGFVVSTRNEKTTDRIEEVKKIYKIEPTKILSHEGTYHLIFNLNKGIGESAYSLHKKSLALLYHGKSFDYHFYNDNVEYEGKICPKLIEVLSNITFIKTDVKVERSLSKDNLVEYNKSNQLHIIDVMEKLGKKDLDYMDTDLNIHINKGLPFQYVMFELDSKTKTFEFFNENFDLNFQDEIDHSLVVTEEGVLIKENGHKFLSDTNGYYNINKDGEKCRLTDFFITVHYKLKKSDKETVFIVSLHNESADVHSTKIEWINQTSKTQFSDYLQKLGNFHFLGANQAVIGHIHGKICDAKVPEIKYVLGFGFHNDLGIAIFRNGIWDIKERVFTPKTGSEKYFFNSRGKGFFPTDINGNSLLGIIGESTPMIPSTKLVDKNECFNLMERLYKGDTGKFLLLFLFGMLGYSLFARISKFPILFVRGCTGSGKSEYVKLLQKIFGMVGKSTSFEHSTVFTMNVMMTYMVKFPFFITEFSEGTRDIKPKTEILKSNFDGTGTMKGRADQSIVKYDFAAIPIIDGEEMINNGAVRSRCIQKQFLSGHKIDGNFEKMVNEEGGILEGLLYTYLSFADEEKYLKYKNEGFDLFKSSASRIRESFAFIYAGCMCFDEDRKDEYLKILEKSLEFQNMDYKENGTPNQIIKLIGKFLSNSYDYESPVMDIPKEKQLIINRDKVCEYASKKRDNGLSNGIESYKEHLATMGFHFGEADNEATFKTIIGPIIPYDKIPKEFKVDSTFYRAYKSYHSGKDIRKDI